MEISLNSWILVDQSNDVISLTILPYDFLFYVPIEFEELLHLLHFTSVITPYHSNLTAVLNAHISFSVFRWSMSGTHPLARQRLIWDTSTVMRGLWCRTRILPTPTKYRRATSASTRAESTTECFLTTLLVPLSKFHPHVCSLTDIKLLRTMQLLLVLVELWLVWSLKLVSIPSILPGVWRYVR